MDLDYDLASATLRARRAPGCSERCAATVYTTLSQLGLDKGTSLDVNRRAMKQASAAVMPPPITTATLARNRDSSTTSVDARASGASAKPGKAVPPPSMLFKPPVSKLASEEGWQRKLHNEIVRLSVDPAAMKDLDDAVNADKRNAAAALNARRANVTNFLTAHRDSFRDGAAGGFDAKSRARASANRAAERDRRGELCRARKDAISRERANRETSYEANARLREAAAAAREARERKRRSGLVKILVRARWRRAARGALENKEMFTNPDFAEHLAAARVIQRCWRGAVARKKVKKFVKAVMLIQPRVKLWAHLKRRRDAATHILRFLETVAAGTEIVRRLHQLRRACLTIQAHYRCAFMKTPDLENAFIHHWNCYERWVHTIRSAKAKRKVGKAQSRLRAFKMSNLKHFDELDSREMMPTEIKRDLVKKFLRARRERRVRDYDAYKIELDDWKANSHREAQMEMARAVLRGQHVSLEAMKEAIKSAKPKMRWRRWLMSTEELAVIHAEGEKAWELHKKFEEITIKKLDVLVRAARFSS